MGSALLDTTPETRTAEAARLTTASAPSSDSLRDEVAERLAAHRNRRAQMLGQSAENAAPKATRAASGRTDQPSEQVRREPRTAQIAAAVAERYKNSQSYRAFLAAEAERAVQQAQAAAEVAALNAQALAAAQQSLLDALDSEQLSPEAAHQNPEGNDFVKGTGSPVPYATPQSNVALAAEVTGRTHAAEELSLWPDVERVAHYSHAPKRHAPTHRAHPRPAAAPAA